MQNIERNHFTVYTAQALTRCCYLSHEKQLIIITVNTEFSKSISYLLLAFD